MFSRKSMTQQRDRKQLAMSAKEGEELRNDSTVFSNSISAYRFSGQIGLTFNISWKHRRRLDEVRRRSTVSIDDIEQFVFLTAADVSHFPESRHLIVSVQKYFPFSRILFYDLRLPPRYIKEVDMNPEFIYLIKLTLIQFLIKLN